MKIVAGLNLNSIKPRVWDTASPYYLSDLDAVMVSYAEFHQNRTRYRRAIEGGIAHQS